MFGLKSLTIRENKNAIFVPSRVHYSDLPSTALQSHEISSELLVPVFQSCLSHHQTHSAVAQILVSLASVSPPLVLVAPPVH